MKISFILITLLYNFCLADHLSDAKMFRSHGNVKKSAYSAMSGCKQLDAKSCNYLCALGIEYDKRDWLAAGCETACLLSEYESCTTIGSLQIQWGQDEKGLKNLKLGCKGGDALACSQLRILQKVIERTTGK